MERRGRGKHTLTNHRVSSYILEGTLRTYASMLAVLVPIYSFNNLFLRLVLDLLELRVTGDKPINRKVVLLVELVSEFFSRQGVVLSHSSLGGCFSTATTPILHPFVDGLAELLHKLLHELNLVEWRQARDAEHVFLLRQIGLTPFHCPINTHLLSLVIVLFQSDQHHDQSVGHWILNNLCDFLQLGVLSDFLDYLVLCNVDLDAFQQFSVSLRLPCCVHNAFTGLGVGFVGLLEVS